MCRFNAGKNFREAQRIKQEKERLLAEKATVTSLLDEERQNTVQYNEQLTKLQGHLDELRAEYLQAEEECGRLRTAAVCCGVCNNAHVHTC